MPRRPSIDPICAVSSPQTKAPAPSLMVMSKSQPVPSTFLPRYCRYSSANSSSAAAIRSANAVAQKRCSPAAIPARLSAASSRAGGAGDAARSSASSSPARARGSPAPHRRDDIPKCQMSTISSCTWTRSASWCFHHLYPWCSTSSAHSTQMARCQAKPWSVQSACTRRFMRSCMPSMVCSASRMSSPNTSPARERDCAGFVRTRDWQMCQRLAIAK